MSNIDFDFLIHEFNNNYNFLYEHDSFFDIKVFCHIFDYLLENSCYFKDLVKVFCKYTQDFISSDRESASFILALKVIGLIKDIKQDNNEIYFIFNNTQY